MYHRNLLLVVSHQKKVDTRKHLTMRIRQVPHLNYNIPSATDNAVNPVGVANAAATKVIGNKEYALYYHQWFNQNVVFG
jgi:uncharacterized protein YhdP